MDQIYPRSGDALGDLVLGHEVEFIRRHANGKMFVEACHGLVIPLNAVPESIIIRQPRGKGGCSGRWYKGMDGETLQHEMGYLVCDRDHGHEGDHGPTEPTGWVPPRDEDPGTPIYILVYVKPSSRAFIDFAPPTPQVVADHIERNLKHRVTSGGWTIASVGTWDPYASPDPDHGPGKCVSVKDEAATAQRLFELGRQSALGRMGKATWEWDDELGVHVPCCTYVGVFRRPSYSNREIGKCGNGPLTGDEIATGLCSEHKIVEAPDLGPGGAQASVGSADTTPQEPPRNAEPKVCDTVSMTATFTTGPDGQPKAERAEPKEHDVCPSCVHFERYHAAGLGCSVETCPCEWWRDKQEPAVDPAIEAARRKATMFMVRDALTTEEWAEVIAAVDKARAERTEPFGWWVTFGSGASFFTKTREAHIRTDQAIPLYTHSPKEA